MQPATNQLREALHLSEQIDQLQRRLNAILSGRGGAVAPAAAPSAPASSPAAGRKRRLSPATRARIAAAARARWAKIKGRGGATKASAAAPKKKKGGLTPEGRARLAAAMKARWAARRRGK